MINIINNDCMDNGQGCNQSNSFSEDVLLDEMKKKFLEFNNTKTDYPSHQTIHELFRRQAEVTPGKTAIICEEVRVSFKELNEKSDQVACLLREKGVKQDTIVGIMIRRSSEMIIGILGVLKAGGAYLPIDPDYPEDRIMYMLEDSNANILLTQEISKNKVNFSEEIIYVDKISFYKEITLDISNINKSTDLAYVIYTSGSTGKPKGVMIEHKSVINFIKGVTDKIDFSQDKKILALTTISFDIFVLETLLPLIKGLTVVLALEKQQKNPKLISKLITENNIDMLQMTPSRMQLLLTHVKSLSCFKNIKDILIGGEAFPEALLIQLRYLTNANIYNLYGPTETTVWSAIRDLTNADKINIGKPVANTQIYIVDEKFNIQPIGAEGELCIAGDGLARGYINNKELTNDRFVYGSFFHKERVYKTGDMARWLPDGNIEYLGRLDNQVKIRGYRVELAEIESQLMEIDMVKEAIVVSKVGKDGIKYLCAYIVPNDGLMLPLLKDYLSKELPDYMIPSYFIKIERLPLTPNGKIDRKKLSEYELIINDRFEYEIKNNGELIKLETIEAGIKAILCENSDLPISTEQIEIDQDLSGLGINSITYVKIVVAAETEFGIEFDDDALDISRFKTIRDFINYIADRKKDS